MRNAAEIEKEIDRLATMEELDQSGLAVRMLTLIALEWVMGLNPVSPADRLEQVSDHDGVVIKENNNGE